MYRLKKYFFLLYSKLRRLMRKVIMKKYSAVTDGVNIFTELADIYGDTINNTYEAEKFFNEFMSETHGIVNLDYLDADNDDRIEKIDFCHDEGIIRICTRIPEKDIELRKMRKMVLHFDTYSLFVRLRNIRFVRLKSKKCIAIAINGFTMSRKQVKKYVSKGFVNVSEPSYSTSFFSSEIIREKDRLYEYMRAMTTPITSFWIIPKSLHFSAEDSKRLLYHYNIEQLTKRLKTSILKLNKNLGETIDQEEKNDLVKMYGNRIRSLTEAFFKLVACFYHDNAPTKKDDYNNRLLGEVITHLKKNIYKTENDAKLLNFIERIANELSHDTGLPVKMHDIELLCKYLQYYIGDFDTKIDMNTLEFPETNTEVKPSNKAYVETNFAKWNFSDEMSTVKKAKSGLCKFTIEIYSGIHFCSSFSNDIDILCEDGYVKTLPVSDLSEAFVLYSREEVILLQEVIISSVKKKCREAGLDDESVSLSFEIHLKKVRRPEHLFTLDEIKTLMRNANDEENNKLVIDENGKAHIIQVPLQGKLYPVSIETWGAGNNYVGASSSLADAEPAYHLCLKLWLAYLETGCRQYDDYYDFVDQEMTIKKIKDLYKTPI